VNTWVREQKGANEKLGNKIREQSKAIVQLSSEKDGTQEQSDLVSKENKKLLQELDERRIDYDKFKALQSHSAHQQVLLHQLRNRLEEHENEQDMELKEKLTTIEDLHVRLKNNVDSVQQLNQQLSNLQKENLKSRADLERELATRQTLQLQVESKDQVISTLKAQLEAKGVKAIITETPTSSPRKVSHSPSREPLSRSLLGTALEETAASDQPDLDKNYWISRVGELSVQLQQSSEYWSDKVRDLQGQLETKTKAQPLAS